MNINMVNKMTTERITKISDKVYTLIKLFGNYLTDVILYNDCTDFGIINEHAYESCMALDSLKDKYKYMYNSHNIFCMYHLDNDYPYPNDYLYQLDSHTYHVAENANDDLELKFSLEYDDASYSPTAECVHKYLKEKLDENNKTTLGKLKDYLHDLLSSVPSYIQYVPEEIDIIISVSGNETYLNEYRAKLDYQLKLYRSRYRNNDANMEEI